MHIIYITQEIPNQVQTKFLRVRNRKGNCFRDGRKHSYSYSYEFSPSLLFLLLHLLSCIRFNQLQIRTLNNESLVKIGPRGHLVGETFDEVGLGNAKQIVICYDHHGINSIQMAYELNGKVTLGGRHGGTTSICHTFHSVSPITI